MQKNKDELVPKLIQILLGMEATMSNFRSVASHLNYTEFFF